MDLQPEKHRRRRTCRQRCVVAAAATAALFAAGAQAGPSVPWMPDAATRHSIELLVDEAGLDMPVLQWPLPRDAVAHALDELPPDLPDRLATARDRVRDALQRQRSAELDVRVRPHADTLAGFGDDATPGSSLELRSAGWQSPQVALQVGARVESQPTPHAAGSVLRLDDSAAVTGAYGVALQAFAHRNWWGPGWQSALALSNNAPALAGVGLQRESASTSESPWLSWLGPWSAEVFLARQEGFSSPDRPFIVGSRIDFRPFSHLEIGFERTAQWGGAGHGQSLGSFVNMLLSRGVNADTVSQQSKDPANEMAGYDARLTCPAFLHCAVYGQAIGEDSAGGLPSRFLALGGLELWTPDGSQRFFVEDARTSAYRAWFGKPLVGYAYRNYAYPEGYVNGGRWLGANAGPDSRIATFGWIDAWLDSTVRLSVGHIGSRVGTFSPTTFDPASSGRMLALSARRSFAWASATWTPEVDWYHLQSPTGDRHDTRLGLEMSLPLDDLTPAADVGNGFAGLHGDVSAQVALGAALIGGAALLDRPADRYARAHGHDVPSLAVSHVGAALPVVEFGVAGLAWLASSDARVERVGLTSVESGLTSLALAEAVKSVARRARPADGRGADDYGHVSGFASSFPSVHAAVAWGLLTPAAQEFDAPWLYGVAAVTGAGRVLGRDHWLSDVVAGALAGYWIGDAFEAHGRRTAQEGARFTLGARSVGVSVPFR